MNLNFLRAILNSARNIQRKLNMQRRLPNSVWTGLCISSAISPDLVSLDESGNLLLRLERNLIRLPQTESAFRLLSGYSFLRNLEGETDCQLHWNVEQDALALRFGDAIYLADNAEEIYILSEIYVVGDYDFAVSEAASTVVVDIGANVGFTAVFLASQNSNLMIEACEPVRASYGKALRNVAENHNLINRIMLHNFGLFSQSGEMQIISNLNKRGCSSLIMDRSQSGDETFSVEMRRASDFLKDVITRHPTKKIVLKRKPLLSKA